MVKTEAKPSSDRSAKERRNVLFRCLDGVLSIAHQKTVSYTHLTLPTILLV